MEEGSIITQQDLSKRKIKETCLGNEWKTENWEKAAKSLTEPGEKDIQLKSK